MLTEHYRAMARYNRWMNERLYALCAQLSDEDRQRDQGAFFGSIHGTLNHLLLADRIWLGRFTHDPKLSESRDSAGAVIAITGLNQILYEDFAQLAKERARTDADIERWVSGLSEQQVASDFSYKSMGGVAASHPLWPALSHLFNHQTHHRGQITTLLTQMGRDIGSTDLIAFLRS